MKKVFLIFILYLVPFGLHASDEITICKNVPDLNSLWLNNYSKQFEITDAQDISNCQDSKSLKLATAFYILSSITSGNGSFYSYLTKYITNGILNVPSLQTSQGDKLYAAATEDKGIMITNTYYADTSNMDVYERPATLFHETRHVSAGPAARHVPCTFEGNPYYSSSKNLAIKTASRGQVGGCDATLTDSWATNGAFGYEVGMLRNLYDQGVIQSSNGTSIQVDKPRIMSWIKRILETSFNNVPDGLYRSLTRP